MLFRSPINLKTNIAAYETVYNEVIKDTSSITETPTIDILNTDTPSGRRLNKYESKYAHLEKGFKQTKLSSKPILGSILRNSKETLEQSEKLNPELNSDN